MRRFLDRFKFHGLFVKMFIIMVVSIIAVSILITWSTIRISERLFIETFSITNSKVISQINSGLESFNYSIITASSNILQNGTIKRFLTEGDSDSLTMFKAFYNMNLQMMQITSNLDAYEVSINVIGMNGRSYASNRSNWPISDNELKQHDMTAYTHQQPKRLLYHLDHGDEHREPTIVAAKALMDRATGNIYGSMYFAIRESEFRRFYASYTSIGNDVIVLNRSGVIVSSNQVNLIGQKANDLLAHAIELEEQALEYKDAYVMGKEQIVLSDYLSSYDLYLVNLIDKQLALGQLIDTKAIVLICIAIVTGALIIVFLISRRLTKSLTRLVKQIANISKYEFDHYVTVSGSYETRQLAQAFNSMLDELHDYVKELVQTQKRQRNAELAALQRQINPHFLYNTLASIKIMVQQSSKEKAAETINALISLLQNAIGNVNETISVEQELVNLKNYAFINQVRYGDRIKVSYFVAPDCMEAQVPKLIIQPFIENAFFHAFNIKPEGYIYVMISRESEALICEVADNGDGMRSEAGRKLPKSQSKRQLFTGIGVRNVHERLLLLYGEPYGVTITSEIGGGTRVRIKLPFIQTKEKTKF
ncbi:cache domain-containing sensor histidine kinase [Paenibacillus abyssi]|uniref:Histidine kinase n=1 Tax=Paenibacillus abyssi TaxID=1340531 RepID=A0A917D775_9BACL|nr:sensor histidine kinase [Paenibacillus abyssi]GGG11215.1 histidine kinase [Paenibacillus abyssi]